MADPVSLSSDVVTLAKIAGGVTLATLGLQIFQAIILKRMDRKQTDRAEVAAVKVEAVKEELKTTTKATTEKLGEIHTMVNGSHGEALRIGAISARALYKLDPNPENKSLMDAAINKLTEHEEREAMVRDDKLGGHTYTHTSYMGDE